MIRCVAVARAYRRRPRRENVVYELQTTTLRVSTLLKACRARISAECRTLGQFVRMPARVGKPVTQEEIAEAAEISREWYARMEADCPVRASSRTLARIAESLMMKPAERLALFQLALPEIGRCDLL